MKSKKGIYGIPAVEKTNVNGKDTVATMKKGILALFMLLCLTGMLFAQAGTTQPLPPAGEGTEESPYLIGNLANLRWASENSSDWWIDATTLVHFRQTANINAAETENWNDGDAFRPIGGSSETAPSFTGVYDGGDYIISHLHIKSTTTRTRVGLFGNFTGAESIIKNVHLENINFVVETEISTITGGIAGAGANGIIQNCFVSGVIDITSNVPGTTGSAYPNTGGIVGNASSSLNVKACTSTVVINVTLIRGVNSHQLRTGGIVGNALTNTIIEQCTFDGEINWTDVITAAAFPRTGGIVGQISGSTIVRDSYSKGTIRVIRVSTSGTATTNGSNTGGIVGMIENTNTIENCHFSGILIVESKAPNVGGIAGLRTSGGPGTFVTIRGCSFVGYISLIGATGTVYGGGIIGSQSTDTTIENCYFEGELFVTASEGAGLSGAGGIAGTGSSTIRNSFSIGKVSIINFEPGAAVFGRAGGLVGNQAGGTAIIQNSYSRATVTGSGPGLLNLGGLVGNSTGQIQRSYAAGEVIGDTTNKGGITGNTTGTITNSFWDTETSGLAHAFPTTTPENSFGLTTSEMKNATRFIDNGWDFEEIWDIAANINSGYPHLRFFDYEIELTFNPPANLTAILSGTSVELIWEMPNPNYKSQITNHKYLNADAFMEGARGGRVLSSFRIYRNGTQIAENVFTTFFTDENVVNDTPYVYHVIAVYSNPDGESEPSNVAELHTMFPPRDLTYAFDGSNIELKWVAPGFEMYNGEWKMENGVVNSFLQGMPRSNSTDAFMLSTIGYNVYRDDVLQNQNPITTLSWVDTNTIPETRYVYEVTAVYEAGESAPVEIIIVSSGLEFNPPQLLTAVVGDGLVHLAWYLPEVDPSVPDLSLNHFRVHRNGDPIADNINQTQYFDHEVINQTPYSYYVTAVYTYMGATVESIPSNIFELVARFPVRNLTATSVRFDVKLDWEAPSSEMYNGEWIMENGIVNQFLQGMPCSNSTDAFMLSEISYNIYRDNTLLTPTPLTTLTFTDDRTTPAAQYTYRVNAVYDGIESPSVERQIIIPLFTPPTSLVANADEKGNVELSWTAPSEMLEFEVLLGYRVYRDDEPLTDSINASVQFTDKVDVSGEYIYKVIAVYELGESDPVEEKIYITVSEDDISILPITTELVGNYPNPFNPETVIRFNMADEGNVNIEIFNIRGQKVRTLVDGFVERGEHAVVWNGTDENGRGVSSGVYFYVMRADGVNASVRRMVLLK